MSTPKLVHLLGLEGVERSIIDEILTKAEVFLEILDRQIPKVPSLKGITIANMFFESSTRTKLSFELAEKRLSADILNFSSSGSSLSKGETLIDTVKNIEAMKIDIIVIRHSASGSPLLLTKHCTSKVINAGDGRHEHPTQALLDMLTIKQELGKLEGLKVLILGDAAHSRVARSNIYGLKTMGAEVTVCAPKTLMPRDLKHFGVNITYNLDEGLRWCDAVNVLRLQKERMDQGYLPTLREYSMEFGLSKARLEKAQKKILVLHPGPMNRGVEINSDVADADDSVILKQVTNGVAVRMAVLYMVAGYERQIDG